MPLNLPNLLTWLRILMIPLVVGVFYFPEHLIAWHAKNLIAAWVFVAAALTDLLDGYLARALNQTSAFGAFLDPVADKLMVTGALVVLLQLDRVDPLVAFIIIGREIAISALREWMARLGQGGSVAVAFVGKLKTAMQMIAIPLLLYGSRLYFGLDAQWLGTALISVAAVLTVISMLYYLRMALPHLLVADKDV